tara:strand:+ start:290 stop:934 length:645 start_codon:yes stop_codon:yes gene_type:complete
MTEEENLIKEVNKEIKQDEYKKLWKKYSKLIIIAIFLIITFVASGTIYKNYKISKFEKQSELYFDALDHLKNENYNEAEKILIKINNLDNGGYSNLSAFNLIDIKSKKNSSIDINKIKLNNNKFLEDFFILKKFNYLLNNQIDDVSINEIIKISKPKSSWRFTAHELLASYYIEKNDIDNAIQSLNFIIKDPDSPSLMKERVLIILKTLNTTNE